MHTQPTLGRRRVLGLLAGAGAVAFTACRADDGNTTATAADTSSAFNVGEIPSETAGPYPGDGTNGPNILTQSGVVRRDIRPSLTGSGKANGVGLDVVMTIVDVATGRAVPGAAVYLWHCDAQGRYSMYSQGAADETYCRGVQIADASGVLRFTSVFPAAYDGRWPHIHFEVFDSAQRATSGRNARKVTQLALPEPTCETVYATSGYESSRQNLADSSLSSDMVFRDGVDRQLATLTGSVSAGYTASLVVGV